MTALLVLTAGQSDVQLVVDGVRRELRKERCAALHDEIERRAGSLRLVDPPDGKGEPAVDVLPEGELLLCTPKLDAALSYLDEHEEAPMAALVLETRRDASAVPEDPRFAGAILEARLKAKGLETVQCRAYLEGVERLENRDDPRDAVIRREVVHRLEQAVRECIDTMKPSRIVVATTGGFPVVSSLVEEIVQLIASTPVEAIAVADGSRASPPTADRAVPRTSVPEPRLSFHARRRALELIAKGNLLGAWAVAEPLCGEEAEREWTQVIDWLAHFASSLPMPPSCNIAVLVHPHMAVQAAIRVELALRAGDIPKAVHGTVAFFEAALWDHLGERLERSSDPAKRRYFKVKRGEAPSGDKLVRKNDRSDEDRKRPFIKKEMVDGTDWYWIDDTEICAIQLAKHYLKRERLTKLGQAVSGDIRELRNDVDHNEPTPALMVDARHRMASASLWSERDTFLTQPLVQEVLRELGEPDPELLLDDLLRTVRTRLRARP